MKRMIKSAVQLITMESVAGKAQFQTSHILSDCKVAVTRQAISKDMNCFHVENCCNCHFYTKTASNVVIASIVSVLERLHCIENVNILV